MKWSCRHPRALLRLAFGLVLLVATASMPQAQPSKQAATAPTPSGGVANPLQGFSQNRDEPIHINSRRLEVQDKKKVATFVGDVHLTQGDTTLTCQTLIVYYEQNAASGKDPGVVQAQSGPAGGQQQIRRLIAKGDVVVMQKDQTATGNQGVFEMKTNIVTLEGNVVVTQGPNVVRGDRLVVDLTSGLSRVQSAHGNGRVEGLFLPSSQPGPKAPNAKPGASPAEIGSGSPTNSAAQSPRRNGE
jgi:lipopolysaccharide export system protein LptA